MAVGNKASAEVMVGNNAVLSFITGRLDRLMPESIPSLISDSAFVKQAISAPEVSDLMQLPMGVGELSKYFEIDQSIMNKAAANGLDPSLKVTPKEFLAAIGVDPGKVMAELSLLQQRLPVEGAISYVERAKAMAMQFSAKAKGASDSAGLDLGADSLKAVAAKPATIRLRQRRQQDVVPPMMSFDATWARALSRHPGTWR